MSEGSLGTWSVFLFILKHLDSLQASVTGKNENNNNPIPSECKKSTSHTQAISQVVQIAERKQRFHTACVRAHMHTYALSFC